MNDYDFNLTDDDEMCLETLDKVLVKTHSEKRKKKVRKQINNRINNGRKTNEKI